jgi:hypothetical protein
MAEDHNELAFLHGKRDVIDRADGSGFPAFAVLGVVLFVFMNEI